MHNVSGALFQVLRRINVYMCATPMGCGSCVVQHLQACGSVGMPTYLIRTQLASYRGACAQHSKPEIVWSVIDGKLQIDHNIGQETTVRLGMCWLQLVLVWGGLCFNNNVTGMLSQTCPLPVYTEN